MTKLEKRVRELEKALSDIIAYRDYEPWTHSTSAPSRMEEEGEVWDRARKLVNKPKPPPQCPARESGGVQCVLGKGHAGSHTATVPATRRW